MRRPQAAAVLALYVLALAALTLGESPGDLVDWVAARAHRVDALSFVTESSVERAMNVALFVPAGLLLCYALPRTSRWLVWLICVAVSLGIEAVQLPLSGRDATPIDVVTNSTGAAIGVLLHALLPARQRRGRALPHRQT